jgi:hypothetical protein
MKQKMFILLWKNTNCIIFILKEYYEKIFSTFVEQHSNLGAKSKDGLRVLTISVVQK